MITTPREYRVGIFPIEGTKRFSAYLRDYNPSWKGCCEHNVEAFSGAEAKRTAISEHKERCCSMTANPIVADKLLNIITFQNYTIVVDDRQTPWGVVRHLEISRKDNQPIHNWHDLQRIKNEVAGEHRVAVEVYPDVDRLVDAQHAYHLWVLPEGFELPFGIHEKDLPDDD